MFTLLSSKQLHNPGGFDGTSNVLAGKLYGIPIRGTHAHAFVTSFIGLEDLNTRTLTPNDGAELPEKVRDY